MLRIKSFWVHIAVSEVWRGILMNWKTLEQPFFFFFSCLKICKRTKILYPEQEGFWVREGSRLASRAYTNFCGCRAESWWLKFKLNYFSWMGLPCCLSGKEFACQCSRCKFDPGVGKIPCRRTWQLIPVFLPENLMDRGAWWAIVHRVTKSRTWFSDWTTQPKNYLLLKVWNNKVSYL